MPMNRNKIQNRNSIQKQLLFVIAFVVLMAIGARISFDIGGEVRLSLQTLSLSVLYYLMNKRLRFISVLLYLFLGIAGLAVFSNGTAGWEHFIGSGLGFFIGFILAAWPNPMTGNFQNILSYMILVHLIILLVGLTVLAIQEKDFAVYSNLGLALLPGAVLKSLLAAFLCYLIDGSSALNSLNAR